MKAAVMGYGTIGSGVVEVLDINGSSIAKRVGEPVEIKYVLDLRDFPGDPIQDKIVHDYKTIAEDPEVKIVVETMGGVEPAYTFVKAMLEAGKHVTTSNKALVAAKGAELIALAKEKNVKLNNDYVTDEEMREAFINCDWAIVPYNSASQSGIIIDAYKYSRPVIAFAVGAIPEQVDADKSGYLVTAGDNEKFADKLKEAAKLSLGEYDAMSRYAYQYGCKKYATSGAVERFVDLLEENK